MTTKVGDIYYEVDMELGALLTGQRQADKALNDLEKSFEKTNKSSQSLDTGLTKLASTIKAVIAASVLREMASLVQKYQEMSERVQMATASQAEFEMVQARLLKTANGTYRALGEAQELYIRTADSLRSMGYATAQAIDVQDSMSYAFVKNATSVDRANNAIDAFSKSINTGKVAADQWETITTAIPSVINDIAAASNKSAAEIRALGAAGKLTAQQLTEGLRQSLEANTAAAAGMSNNLVDAGVRMKTAITSVLVEIEKSTGALQGFTNEIISVADAMLDFSSDTDKMPIAINAATVAAGALGGILAGRLLAGLVTATKGKAETIAASVKQSAADRQLAKDELGAATAIQRRAVVEKEAAVVERQRATESLASLKATNALTVAEVAHADAELASIKTSLQQIQAEKALEIQRGKAQITEQGRIATATRMAQLRQAEAVLTQQAARAESVAQNARAVAYEGASARIAAANAVVATTTSAVRAANGAVAASQERVAATSITMAGALKSVNTALMPLGGVAGVVMMIAAGWYMYAQNQEAARQKNIEFADSLPDLISRMKELNAVQLQGALGDTAKSIAAQHEKISTLTDSVKEAEAEYEKYIGLARQFGVEQDKNNGYVKNANEWFYTLSQRKRDLNDATDRLNTTLSQQSQIQEQVNQKARESEEAFNVLANNLRNKIPGASEATISALATTIQMLDQLNKKASDGNVKQEEPTDSPEAKKLIQNAERRLELAKLEGEARARLQAQYDAEDVGYTKDDPYTKRLQDRYAAIERETQSRKEANSEGKKSASSAESIAQKLEKLRQQSDLTTESIEKRRIQEAGLNAQQSLGSAATKQQLAEAKALGEANEKAAISLQKRNEAEQGQKYANQEIAAAKVMPDAVTGTAIDPVAQIDLQERQKLEALAKYQALDLQNSQLYEDAKTAIQQQAANAREQISITERQTYQQNMSSLLGATSDSVGAVADAIGQAAGKSSGAYQAMFAVSKGFAIAQAALNMQTAIGNAMALPWPANIPAIAQAVAAGGQMVSAVSGISYAGAREHGGQVNANSMYRVGEGGKPEIYQANNGSQYMIPGDNGRVISNRDIGGGGGAFNFSPIINLNGDYSAQQQAILEAAVKRGAQQGYAMAVSDVASGKGKLSNALTNNFNTSQRLT